MTDEEIMQSKLEHWQHRAFFAAVVTRGTPSRRAWGGWALNRTFQWDYGIQGWARR